MITVPAGVDAMALIMSFLKILAPFGALGMCTLMFHIIVKALKRIRGGI